MILIKRCLVFRLQHALATFLVYSVLFLLPSDVPESKATGLGEICYLDGDYVLLYKIINWWNDSPPEDRHLPCGNTVLCKSGDNIGLHHDQVHQSLRMTAPAGFAGLVSIGNESTLPKHSMVLHAQSINPKYFRSNQAISFQQSATNQWYAHCSNVTTSQYQKLLTLKSHLAFIVTGSIHGLLLEQGTIALHSQGSFLRSCPLLRHDQPQKRAAKLKIINTLNGEVLAEYVSSQ